MGEFKDDKKHGEGIELLRDSLKKYEIKYYKNEILKKTFVGKEQVKVELSEN